MPPKTRSKSSPLWHRCEKCQVVLPSKDLNIHQEGSCPPQIESWTHGFIKKKVLYSWLGEVSSADSLPALPSEEIENMVFVSLSAIQLCGFFIGDPVLVEARGCLAIKSVWPTTEKTVTSVLLTKEGLEFANDLINAPVIVKKISCPIPPAQEVVVHVCNTSHPYGQQVADVLLILKHKYSGKYLKAGSKIQVPFYGRKLKFIVYEVKCLPTVNQTTSTINSPDALESITDNLQNMSFSDMQSGSEASCSTPVGKKSNFQLKRAFGSVSSTDTPVRRPFRNMLEDSYAGSSTEDSIDELSSTVDSFSESPTKEIPIFNSGFYHITHSTEWRIKDLDQDNKAEQSVPKKLIGTIGGLQQVINEVKEIMSLALNPSSSWQHGLRISKGVLLFGPSGTGKTMLAHALAQDSAASVHTLIGSELFSKVLGETDARLRSFFSNATSSGPAVIILDEIDSLCSKKNSSSGSELERRLVTTLCTLLDGLSSSNKKVFVIATTSRPDSVESSIRRPGRLDREIEVPVPTPEARFEILHELLKPVPHSLSETELLSVAQAAHGFVGADLASLVSQAGTYALKSSFENSSVTIRLAHVQWALARINPSAMREVLVDVPNVRWSDIGGQEDLKLKLKQAVEWPLSHPEAFERLGIKPPRGVLMFGPPGCSKTMIAKALATESKLNFLSIKGPELFSKWVGESERAVREVFRRARQVAPAIIFFDELDALGGERGSGGSGGGSNVQERVLAQLLTEMDGVTALGNVTVVAATNRPDRIDKALLRPGRLDRIVYVPLPDTNSRKQIFDIQLKKMPISDDLNVNYLVQKTEGYSGAEVLAVCHEAALKALEENISAQFVTQNHFDVALEIVTPRTPPSLLKLYNDYLNR